MHVVATYLKFACCISLPDFSPAAISERCFIVVTLVDGGGLSNDDDIFVIVKYTCGTDRNIRLHHVHCRYASI